MKQKNEMKSIVYKMAFVALVVVLLTGIGIVPAKKSQAKGKTFRQEVILQEGMRTSADSYIEWKSTKPNVASGDLFGYVYALNAGKTTLTGVDSAKNKYIIKVTVIKPVKLQIKKVKKTKKTVQFTLKNLGKKTITFPERSAAYFPDPTDSDKSEQGINQHKVSIKPQKTATITIESLYNFKFKGNSSFDKTIIEYYYGGVGFNLTLESKPTKNTNKGSTELSITNIGEYSIEKGETGNICVLNNKKEVVWSVLSGKENVKIVEKSNHYATIQRIGYGEAKIQAMIGNKKYIVTIKAFKDIGDILEIIYMFYGQNVLNFYTEVGINEVLNSDKYTWGENGRIIGINCSSADLEGSISFSALDALETLDCSNNDLTSLDVSKNAALAFLDCDDNELESLDISNNTALEYLDCSGNDLTSLDLSKNTVLEELNCEENRMGSLDLSKNTALEILNCNHNCVKSLNLSNATALEELHCYENSMKSLDASGATALQKLNCGLNVLKSLDVSKNTELRYLDCSANELEALDVSKNIALIELDCSDNYIVGLDVIGNTALQKFDCSVNELMSLDVSQNIALIELDCGGNYIADLDVSANTALQKFDCSCNELRSLDLSKNTELRSLYCNTNALTSLDVSTATALQELKCYCNKLGSLDMSKNTELKYLQCYDNNLKSLDVSGATVLEELNCYDNSLGSLDISNNVELISLSCANNKLTSLDLSNNILLTRLICVNNKLTSLDVSKNVTLGWLSCDSDLTVIGARGNFTIERE